ncbi:hypothetical protein SAMN04487972_10244 [Paracoccus halophilus]|uniref:Tryptophan-rich sensory protein n=1 Tax=Paracoccus halophilus TaxID=376733 RepID=A0A099F5T7_9RHOB|nr:tryptophan-rich sensory protein [Paracoccus halophilus]KGJ05829.1 hypothetical protein IT41_03925 [Paracoccus halophilus]SFA40857.1 hypothetical protein SAMN04487972_10244 [Paracoccus halophilus]
MNDRIKRLAVLLLAIAFALSPLLSEGFGGFYRESFPVQVERWPAQPAGWAFSIWGVIYLGLIAAAAWSLWRPAAIPGWSRAALPLALSLFIGAFWVETAMRSPPLATAMILPMATAAIMAMRRVGPDWRGWAPLGLYAGWLTAASAVAVSVVLTGYGFAAPRVAAVSLILAALIVAIPVAATRLHIWTYRLGVGWALVGVIAANLQAGDTLIALVCAAGIVALAVLDRLVPRPASRR